MKIFVGIRKCRIREDCRHGGNTFAINEQRLYRAHWTSLQDLEKWTAAKPPFLTTHCQWVRKSMSHRQLLPKGN